MSELAKAVIKVMEECTTIEKGMTVGSGGWSYKGVADKDVKLMVSRSMRNNGLIILPIGIEPKTTVHNYQETNHKGEVKNKTSVFTEVVTKYKLLHTSGEEQELYGYGHGIDNGDKAAGKATTYALKYALLYMFMIATGAIDDSDNTHSDELNAAPAVSGSQSSTPPRASNEPKPHTKAFKIEVFNKFLSGEIKDVNKYASEQGYTLFSSEEANRMKSAKAKKQ